MSIYRVKASWLAEMLSGTPRDDRLHAPCLDVLKAVYDREFAKLNLTAGLVSAVLLTSLGSLIAGLFSRPTGGGEVDTGLQNVASRGFGSDEAGLAIAIGVIVAVMVATYLVHNLNHAGLRQDYSEGISLYFLLHRLYP